MNSKDLYRAINGVDDNILERSESVIHRRKKRHGMMKWGAMAACFCLAVAIVAVSVFSPFGGMVVTAYAYGTNQEITADGATFTTGTLNNDGELTGHPLMFHLAGESIDTVRYSCKNGQINFVDLTEQRDEYGFAQNFTISYGADKSDYSSLLVDWVPNNIIEVLRADNTTIVDLPEDMRHDIIVMEITFANGNSTTKAIVVSLEADGTINAAFDDYKVLASDDFVNRADSVSIPRDTLYKQGQMTVIFYDDKGNEVFPEANWYITKDIDKIVVQWNGRAPDMVQMFFTPSGTETAEQMDFLKTDAVNAENRAILFADSLHRDSLMGYLQIVINFGSNTIQSELYNVIYDPDV